MNEYFKLIWTLCFLGFFSIATEAEPIYLYSDPGAVDTPEEAGLRSEAEVRDLAFRLTGKPVEWKKVETADEAQWSLLEASMDFDLLGILPRNEQELQALVSSRADVNALPMILNHSPYFSGKDFHGHALFLSALKESEDGMVATMVFSVLTPEDQVLHFTGRDILWTGDGMELCHMEMMLEEGLEVADFEFPITIKGSMIPEEASFVSFDCDGFDQFQLLCEYQFPADLVKPVSADQQDVKAKFKIVSKKLGDFIGEASVDPFEIRGLDDVQFEIKEAVVDYSTGQNHASMLDAIDAQWPMDIRSKYQDNTWRGFFLKEFSVLLPEAFNDSAGQRIKIEAIHFFADHGNGISGKVQAKPQLETNVEGWGISLDTVLLSVVANSFDNFKMSGRINIPIMTGTSRYDMLIGLDPENNPEISFTLILDGIYTFPFLDNSSLTLEKGSNAGIKYGKDGFVPHADLSGDIVVKIGNPSVTLPKLSFENLKINDQTVTSYGKSENKEVTGGLDRISIKAFSLGGDRYESSSGGIGMENFRGFPDQEYPDPGAEFIAGGPHEEGYYSDNSTSIPAENKSSEKNNSKLSGIPITINGIGFGKEKEDDGETYYKLNFTIGVNFAADSKAFNSEGGFAVLGKLDFKKLISKEPWEALSFHEVRVDMVKIEADLGPVKIEGGISIIRKDETYGDGFKGGIKMSVKLAMVEFDLNCVGQFGVAPGDFRYFFIDAEVAVSAGIQLGPTGLAIYGFKGGFFYNMEMELEDEKDLALASLAGSQKIEGDKGKELPQGDVLTTPGMSLSGQIYKPKNDHMEFLAGLVFGLSEPHTLLADVAFGMALSDLGKGWGVNKIYFNGGAYLMNEGVSKRKNASALIEVELTIDIDNSRLVGSFGFEIKAPPKASLIEGTYNRSDEKHTNVSFSFGREKSFYFVAGTPNFGEEMMVQFKIPGIDDPIARIKAYFMVAVNHKLPDIPSIADIFIKEGFSINKTDLPNVAQNSLENGTNGIAFGARLVIPPNKYSFLFLRAHLGAMAGFDLSLMHHEWPLCQRADGFGINNWYLQGQAYAALEAALGIYIDLGIIYQGEINLFTLNVYAGLTAKLPNPTYFAGFLNGNYSVLGGLVKGDFKFDFELGEKCVPLAISDEELLANMKLIQDVMPEEGSRIEVYQDLGATFFMPIDETIEFEVPDASKKSGFDKREFKPSLSVKLTKGDEDGSIVSTTLSYRDNKETAVIKPVSLLEPNTDYTLKIEVKVSRVDVAGSAKTESRTVHFKTGDRPTSLVNKAVAYSAPGDRQRNWHRLFALTKIEVDQTGWGYLFPKEETFSFAFSERQADDFIRSLTNNDGWISYYNYGKGGYRKNVNWKYVCRATNIKNNTVTNFPITDYPGLTNLDGKIISFQGLTSANLEKNSIYKLEIIRLPEKIYSPSILNTREIVITKEYNPTDTTFATAEYIEREITTHKNIPDEFEEMVKRMNTETMLYTYYFATSKYNSLYDKLQDLASKGSRSVSSYNVGKLKDIEKNIPSFNSGIANWYDIYSKKLYGTEGFDKYDVQQINNNFYLETEGEFQNPIRSYQASHEDGYYTSKEEHYYTNFLDHYFQVIPYDLFDPVFNKRRISAERVSGWGASIFTDNSGNLSYWLNYNGRKINPNSSSTKLDYATYLKLVSLFREYFTDLNRFQQVQIIGEELLNEVEIRAKSKSSSYDYGGINLISYDPMMIRNVIAWERQQLIFLAALYRSGMKVNPSNAVNSFNKFSLIERYSNNNGIKDINEFIDREYQGRILIEELKTKRIGIKIYLANPDRMLQFIGQRVSKSPPYTRPIVTIDFPVTTLSY